MWFSLDCPPLDIKWLHVDGDNGDVDVSGSEGEDDGGVTDGGNGYKHGEPFCLLFG